MNGASFKTASISSRAFSNVQFLLNSWKRTSSSSGASQYVPESRWMEDTPLRNSCSLISFSESSFEAPLFLFLLFAFLAFGSSLFLFEDEEATPTPLLASAFFNRCLSLSTCACLIVSFTCENKFPVNFAAFLPNCSIFSPAFSNDSWTRTKSSSL